MLYDIINEQGQFPDVRDDFSEKIMFSHVFL